MVSWNEEVYFRAVEERRREKRGATSSSAGADLVGTESTQTRIIRDASAGAPRERKGASGGR